MRVASRGRVPVLAFVLVAAPFAPVVPGSAQSPAAGGPLPAGVEGGNRVVHYDVHGSTPGELLTSMRASGPSRGGRRSFGYHEWNLRWTFRWAPDGSWCRMTEVRVSLTSTTTLPRWRPPAGADRALVADWNTFLRALEEHERGHEANGAEAARQVLRALRGLRDPGCGGMEARANAAARAIVDDYRERDRRYDRETRAGATQGAVWPPRSRSPGGTGTHAPGRPSLPVTHLP